MFLILQHFKRMGAVVQGKSAYDKDAFSANAIVWPFCLALLGVRHPDIPDGCSPKSAPIRGDL